MKPLGYQQMTSIASARGLTVPAGARVVLMQAETQAVLWTDASTVPPTTANVGMVLEAGDTIAYEGNLSAIRVIESVTGAKLNLSFYTHHST